MTKAKLREKILDSLTSQGFLVNGHIAPSSLHKDHFRKIQAFSRKEQIKLQKDFLIQANEIVQKYLVNGRDINPSAIDLELRVVEEGTPEHVLFRWWNLVWWSVPYQRAYGRQMRFILWDNAHNAPFGLIGLQSPILKMAVRDNYLKIPNENLDYVINQSMQAQRLGALPPYNEILGGKMVALALTCNELRKYYQNKYKNVQTILENRIIEPQLLFITTTSAFGRSSIYNRLRYKDEIVAQSLGYTKGSGTFHISEEVYTDIQNLLKSHEVDISTTFGYGPSRKVKLLYKAFSLLGLSEYQYHNIPREFFLFPIAKNFKNVIANGVRPVYYQRSLKDLSDFWKERWLIPRSERNSKWTHFDARTFFISTKRNITRWSK